MHLKQRFLLAIALICFLMATGLLAQTSQVTPETFATLQPDRQGQCRMTVNVTVPCERYKLGEKYYLLLYAMLEDQLTLMKISEIHPDGTLKTQKTIWAHPILYI